MGSALWAYQLPSFRCLLRTEGVVAVFFYMVCVLSGASSWRKAGEKSSSFVTVTECPRRQGRQGYFGSWFQRFWSVAICLCCFWAQHHGKGHMWTTVAHLTADRRQREGQEEVRDKAVPRVSYFLQISPMSFLVSMPSNRLRLWVNPLFGPELSGSNLFREPHLQTMC